jgi:hypothetical protein
VNGWLTVFWIIMIPVSLITHWVSSVVGTVSGHWSAWQAARVEVNQQAEERKRERADLAGDVVERIVAEIDVQPSPG